MIRPVRLTPTSEQAHPGGPLFDHITLETGARLDFFVEGDGDALLIYHHGTPAAGAIPQEISVPAAAHGMVVAGVVRPGYGVDARAGALCR